MEKKNVKATPIVGIGTSAGALETLKELFTLVSTDVDCAIVVVQHLSPDFKSLMKELLEVVTKLKIETLTGPTKPRAGCIYLCPSDKHTLIREDGMLMTEDRDHSSKLYFPIDMFFESLGQNGDFRNSAIILTGTGSDGSRGLFEVKEKGGVVMVQEPKNAMFDGMPKAALMTGQVDFSGTITEIADQINTLYGDENSSLRNGDLVNNDSKSVFKHVLKLISRRFLIDFNKYRPETLIRRLNKRQTLAGFNSLEDYYEFLNDSPEEQEILKDDFLIGVTSFFRDPGLWQRLEMGAITQVLDNIEKGGTMRCWVAGCSSGEEAYTLAMILEKHISNNYEEIEWKIFASDVDSKAIKKASMGEYSENIMISIPEEFHKYLRKGKNGIIKVGKRIRDNIVFTRHDLINDPPFINLDLVICRNVLIYLNVKTQQLILDKFHFSLGHSGFLFLGPSESIGEKGSSFDKLDPKINLFRLKQPLSKRMSATPFKQPVHHKTSAVEQSFTDTLQPNEILNKQSMQQQNRFMQAMLDELAPASLIVKESGQVVYSEGPIHNFVQFPKGILGEQNTLDDLMEFSTALAVRKTIEKCLKDSSTLKTKEVTLQKQRKHTPVIADLLFRPIWVDGFSSRMVLVSFHKSNINAEQESDLVAEGAINKDAEIKVKALEMEVKESRHRLFESKQQMETLNEELQASNEELMGSNEELQSSNEELQSVNEELYTINNEYQNKIEELSSTNNDLNNLLESTGMATIFLDSELKIRRFTPSTTNFVNLTEGDIGRPLEHFKASLNYDDFEGHLRTVYKKLEPIEELVNNKDGNWVTVRILPYLTADKRIEGLVVTFSDMTHMEKAKREIEMSQLKLRAIFDASTDSHFLVSKDYKVLAFNKMAENEVKSFYNKKIEIGDMMTDYLSEDAEQVFYEKMSMALSGEKSLVVQEVNLPNKDQLFYDVHYIPVENADKKIDAVAINIRNTTLETKASKENKKNKELLERILNSIPVMIREEQNGETILFNEAWCNFSGMKLEQLHKTKLSDLVHSDDKRFFEKKHRLAKKNEDPETHSFRMRTKDGDFRYLREQIVPFEHNNEIAFLVVTFDVHNEWLINNQLANANDFAGICAWEYNSLNKELNWTGNPAKTFGLNATPKNFEELCTAFQAADGGKHLKPKWAAMWQFGDTLQHNDRYLTPSGKLKNFAMFGKATDYSEKGKVVRCQGFVQDLTSIQATLNRLNDLQLMLEESVDLFAVTDFDGYFVEISKEWEGLLGYTQEEMKETPFIDFIHEEDLEKTNERFATLTSKKQKIKNFINRYRKKGGGYLNLSWNVISVPDVQKVYCIARDVTDLLHNEEVIRTQSDILTNINKAILTLDKEGIIRYANEYVYRVFGMRPSDLMHQDINILEGKGFDFNKLKEGLGDKQNHDIDWFCQHSHVGDWVNTSISPNYDNRGDQIGYILISEEINEKKKQQVMVRRLSLVSQKAKTAIVITDENKAIEWVNKAFEDLSGWTLEEIKGKLPGKFLHGKETDSMELKKISRALRKNEPVTAEVINYSKSNKAYWVALDIQPIIDESNTITGYLSVQSDITSYKRIQEELTRAKQNAEWSNQKKTEFLANMSHEFRTPLNGIIGLSDLLVHNKALPETDRLVLAKKILQSGERLHQTVDQALQLARIETGKYNLKLEEADINDIIKETIGLLEGLASKKGIELKTILKSNKKIQCDILSMVQVMNNLIGNAIKFTDEGFVIVKTSIVKVQEQSMLLISVRDTGIGIQARDHSLVFKPFEQVSTGTSRSHEGSGLGLSITKELLEAHGGYINLESRFGDGSNFMVYLPVIDS